ncbi:MAG: sigma-54 dependent transcriptional regulator [Bacteroidales bacterium]|nr:sigma-54 dependent transcriptional regulator [Bacteroidales bacterium]
MDNLQLQSLKNRYDIVGNAPELNRALEIASAVAPTDLTVLIAGESGVGKETLPKIIHQFSRRRTGKYFAVNCGAIPEGTIDSELFGHEKGAFTGANEMRKGYFEEADGGTLFLDEIGELPLSSQAKLLRVLQDGEFIRVGSSKVMKTDVRVIAATNVNLAYAVQQGRFRSDLYYRLDAVSISMPALRDRGDDIPLLFRKFTSDFSQKYGVCKLNLTPDAVDLLKSYRWPGNIRQLKNVAETVSALESSKIAPGSPRCEISAAILSRYIPKDEGTLPCVTVHEEGFNATEKEALVRMIYQLRQDVDYLRNKIEGVADKPVIQLPPKDEPEWQDTEEVKPQEEIGADLSIQRAGLDLIRKALDRNDGNRKAAAAELGISERTLYRKLKELENER